MAAINTAVAAAPETSTVLRPGAFIYSGSCGATAQDSAHGPDHNTFFSGATSFDSPRREFKSDAFSASTKSVFSQLERFSTVMNREGIPAWRDF
jgi:hypothetical protein